MFKRKTLALLLAALMLLSLTACGTDGGNVSSTPSSPSLESSTPESADTTTTSGTTTATTTASGKETTSRRPNVTTTEKPTTEKPTATTTMSREQYLNQEKITVVGSASDPKGWIYQLGSGGVMVREVTINSGKGGKAVEIVQMTDLHFNVINQKDREDTANYPVIKAINEFRTLNRNGSSRSNAEACLKYGSYFDQMVITGDTIDYLTYGALEMLDEVIWKPYPNALVTLGNHDIVRTWTFKGYVRDTSTLESRYQILQENWKHDIYYSSKVVGNKAMIIQMDNGNVVFWDSQIPKLKADLEKAKQNGYAVLLFFHIPIDTGNAADEKHMALRNTDGAFDNLNDTSLDMNNSATKQVYDIITNNADVIKGIFAGHVHNDHYSEVVAKTSDGKDAVIPQYILAPAYCDKGHVLKITVK